MPLSLINPWDIYRSLLVNGGSTSVFLWYWWSTHMGQHLDEHAYPFGQNDTNGNLFMWFRTIMSKNLNTKVIVIQTQEHEKILSKL